MARQVKIAAIQMIAHPAPTHQRLERAEALVAGACRDGAQLVVLPELFNTGYEYSSQNYGRAEPLDGPTVTRMKQLAARHHIHLAGTLLLLDENDIYNAMLLVAPDGRIWRYDKNYPWVWERAYFREGHDIAIADTSLGKLGMMICWDTAHPELWARYAGKVDAMVICSCPPAMHDMTIVFPDGRRLRSEDAGPVMRYMQRTSTETFGSYLRRQSAHLGVPVVNTTETGNFSSTVPLPHLSLGIYILMRPDLWSHLRKYKPHESKRVTLTRLTSPMRRSRLGASVAGDRKLRRGRGHLADSPPQPQGTQPPSAFPSGPTLLDEFANVALIPCIGKACAARMDGTWPRSAGRPRSG
jgi:predicted amidohydrolase